MRASGGRSSHVRNDFAIGGVCRDSVCQVRVASAASLEDVAAPLSLIAVGSSSDSRSSPLPWMPRLSAVSPWLYGGGFQAGGCGALVVEPKAIAVV